MIHNTVYLLIHTNTHTYHHHQSALTKCMTVPVYSPLQYD